MTKILNEELSKHEGCEDCRFDGLSAYQEPDSEGCNWRNSILEFAGRDVNPLVQSRAYKIEQEMRRKYNLKVTE